MAGAAPAGPITVTRLATTAIKGTRLREVERVQLDESGARGDRAFFVIDARDRMINSKQLGELQTVVAEHDAQAGRLTITFAGGEAVSGAVQAGPILTTRFFSREYEARLVPGPFAAALSEHLGQPLRLVEFGHAIDRGSRGAASLVSTASLQRLAERAGRDQVDARRFRMLIEVNGVAANEEDGWVGRSARIGGARLRLNGHIGRCLITSRDPDTGVIDLPTLDVLGTYRRELASTEPLPLGIYGEVLEPGPVRVGDPVALDG